MFTRDDLVDEIYGASFLGGYYWIENTEENGDTTTIHPAEGETAVEVDKEKFAQAIDAWAEKNKDSGSDYYTKFSTDWLAGDWDAVDYDHGIADLILQECVFGKHVFG